MRETLDAVARHASYANLADYSLSTFLAHYLRLAPWSGIYVLASILLGLWLCPHLRVTSDKKGSIASVSQPYF